MELMKNEQYYQLKNAPERKNSFDALRILSMWFIMTAHFMGWGGAVNSLTPHDLNCYWVMPLYFVSQTGNTLFFLISGYFLSEAKLEKAVYLERKTAFYALIISLAAALLWRGFSVSLLKSFFPILFNYYWFISVYLVLYLFGTLLGRSSVSVTKIQYLIALAALLINNLFLIEPKYTLLEGLLAFLIGQYMRRFRPFQRTGKTAAALFFVGSVLMYALERFAALKLGIEHTAIDEGCRYFLIIAAAVFLFTFFEKLELQKVRFSRVSKNVVAVYLITAHPHLRNELYQNVLHVEDLCRNDWFILYYFAVNAAIMCGCVLIDKAVSVINRKQADFWCGALLKPRSLRRMAKH